MKPQRACSPSCISEPLQSVVPVEPGVEYQIPHYDMDAFLIEVDLLLDRYLPKLETSFPIPSVAPIGRSGAKHSDDNRG